MTGRPASVGWWLWRPILGASLLQVVLFMVRPAMTYSILDFGGDAATIGWITSLYAIVPMLIAIRIGRIAGRLAHIAILPLASAVTVGAACIVLAAATEIWMLAVASVLLGAGVLAAIIGTQTWISRSAPASRYDDAFGWMTAAMSLGQAIGPLVMGILVGGSSVVHDPAGLTLTYVIAAACCVVTLLCFVTRERREYAETGLSADEVLAANPRAREILRIPGILKYMFASAAVLTTVDLVGAYLPAVGGANGVAPVLIGAMLAVRGVASMVSRLFLGAMVRRWNRVLLTSVSTLASAAAMVAIVAVPTPVVLFAAMVVGGFFLGVVQPLTISSVAMLVPERARSEALAVRLLGNRIAQTVIPLAAAAASTLAGVGAVFVVQAVFLAASTAWVGFRDRRSDPG